MEEKRKEKTIKSRNNKDRNIQQCRKWEYKENKQWERKKGVIREKITGQWERARGKESK